MVLNRTGIKGFFKIFLTVFVSLMFMTAGYSYSGTVVVKPGQFDHFTLQVPDRIIAGENFIIKAQVYDSNNNLITNFTETGKEFKVDIQGTAVVLPSTLSSSSFSGGSANISINSKKAQRIIFSIRESGGSVPVISRELIVLPNKLDHFVLLAPEKVTAGNAFDVRIIAKDLFDNTVDDLNIGRNIKINSTGTASLKMVGGSAVDFKNGMATANFISEKTGNIIIDLQEISTGSSGKTQELIVHPASLSYFKMQAPRNVTAGEAFDLLIAAYDAYDNLVTNYSSTGGGVRFSSTGTSKMEPLLVSPAEFKNGQAIVNAIYEKSEEIQVIAKESNRDQTGKTGDIMVSNSSPDHFVVVTPDTAVSGQRFKIKVESYDRFNNIVKNYNLTGNDVALNTSGNGAISPSRVSPSDFLNGVAMVDITYDKAESFLISARMTTDRTTGRVTVKEQPAKREVEIKEVQRPHIEEARDVTPFAESIPVKKETRKEIKKETKKETKPKVKQETVKKEVSKKEEPVKKEAKPKPKEESKPAPAVAVKEAPKNEQAKKAKETPKQEAIEKPAQKPQKAPEKKTVEVKPEKHEIKPEIKEVKTEKPEIKPSAKTTEEIKKPVIELAKKEDKKVEKPEQKPFSISNVSIIEAKNKAMLVINITNPNGHLDYTDGIESRYGKEWLKLRMKPAIRKSEKSYKFKSAFVGDVMVEEDKSDQNTLNIFVELVPSGVTFDIARIKNTLIVTLSNP